MSSKILYRRVLGHVEDDGDDDGHDDDDDDDGDGDGRRARRSVAGVTNAAF
jgi:hypothetical protein